ncbi:MAG: hypothetical protein Q4C47_00765, partial [Planctomycetia bacterium]|nr:hypothetical protein [Planctomycetia bacterium]
FHAPSEVVTALEPFADTAALRRYCDGHRSVEETPSDVASLRRSAPVPTNVRTARPGSSRLPDATTPSMSATPGSNPESDGTVRETVSTTRYSRRGWLLGTAGVIVTAGAIHRLLSRNAPEPITEDRENRKNDEFVENTENVSSTGVPTQSRESAPDRFLADWATLPGPDGTWWFDEMPWMLPGLRTTLAMRFLDALTPSTSGADLSGGPDNLSGSGTSGAGHSDRPGISGSLCAMDPDRLYDLRERTLQIVERTVREEDTTYLTAATRHLLNVILSMNRAQTTPESALDERLAAQFRTLFEEFRRMVPESELSADDRYTLALLRHKIVSVIPDPTGLSVAQQLYESAIAAYDERISRESAPMETAPEKKREGTSPGMGRADWFRELRRRCLVDYGRLAAEQLRDWTKMTTLFTMAGTAPGMERTGTGVDDGRATSGTGDGTGSGNSDGGGSGIGGTTSGNPAKTTDGYGTSVTDPGRPDFLLIESCIIQGIAAAAISPGDDGGNVGASSIGNDGGGAKTGAGMETGTGTGRSGGEAGEPGGATRQGSALERYSASVNSFRRVTRRLDTGTSATGRLSTGLLAQSYEREAWVRVGFWMIRQARSDFERALGLRETIRSFQLRGQSRTPRPSGPDGMSGSVADGRFSSQELLLYHNRHGIAMTERYLGNPGKAYDDYGGLLEEMWRRYGRLVSRDSDDPDRGAMLPDEARDFFERLSNSSERRGDMVLYHPFPTTDPVLRLARYAGAADLYGDAIRYAVDPKSRQVMRWKQAVLESLISLDDPSRHPRAERLVATLPPMDAAEQKQLASEYHRAVMLSQTASAILALRTPESRFTEVSANTGETGPETVTTSTGTGTEPDGVVAMAERTGKTAAVTASETAEPLRELIRNFWRNSTHVTAHRRERLEILMLAGATLLETGAGDPVHRIPPFPPAQRIADVTLVHRDVISAFRNEYHQLVDATEMLPYLRPFHDQMIRTLLSVVVTVRTSDPTKGSGPGETSDARSAGPSEIMTGTAVERLRRQLRDGVPDGSDVPDGDGLLNGDGVPDGSHGDPAPGDGGRGKTTENGKSGNGKDDGGGESGETTNTVSTDSPPIVRSVTDPVVESVVDPAVLRQIAELIPESRAQRRTDSTSAILFWFAPDNWLTRETSDETIPPWDHETEGRSSPGIAIRWRITGTPELELLPLDFGRREILRASRPLRETSESGRTILRWLTEESSDGTTDADPRMEIFWSDVSCWGDCATVRQAITPAHWTFHFGDPL